MKRMKSIGLSLLAIFALGAFAAATASAEEGFLPRPASANILGKKSKIETSKSTISCTTLDESKAGEKEITSDKHFNIILHWLGCKAEGLFSVNSLGAKSEEILIPVLLLVCLLAKNAKGELLSAFGLAAEVSKVHLEVPSVGVLLEFNGTFIALVLTGGMTQLFILDPLGKKGVPTATDCLEGANVKLHTLTSATNEGTAEAASVEVEAVLIQFPINTQIED